VLQTGALKQRAQQNAISGAIYLAQKRARGKIQRERENQLLSIFTRQNLELLLEVDIASRAKSGFSALQTTFIASKFRAFVENALRKKGYVLLTRDDLLESKRRLFYILYHSKLFFY
jgi:hypothetical protein